jgi:type I restriction enzyme S subunit
VNALAPHTPRKAVNRTAGSEAWKIVRLGDVAEQCLGKMLDAKKNKGEPYPYLRNPNVKWFDIDLSDLQLMPFESHELDRFGVRKGDVLICEGGEAGRAAIWESPRTDVKIQKAIHRVRPGPELFNRFFVYRLMYDYFNGQLANYYTGTTINHFTGQNLAQYEFALPPLPEQRRIAAVLDAADALRAKRKAALAQLDQLTQAIFIEMFGHPVQSPKYERAPIRSLTVAASGKTAGDVASAEPTGIPIYGGNGVNGWAIRALFTEPVVIFGRVGQQCGNTFLTDRPVWVTDNAITLQINDRSRLHPTFLVHGFRMTGFAERVKHLDLPFINQQMILDFELPLPPIEKQAEFARRVSAVSALRSSAEKAAAELDALFASLQHRAFRGEL